MLTKDESRWVKRAQKLFREKPCDLMLYTTDGEIVVCKLGVTSYDYAETIDRNGITPGCVLTDLHDDNDNGNYRQCPNRRAPKRHG